MGTREDDLNELERLARELATARAARERLQGLYEIKYRAHEQAESERDTALARAEKAEADRSEFVSRMAKDEKAHLMGKLSEAIKEKWAAETALASARPYVKHALAYLTDKDDVESTPLHAIGHAVTELHKLDELLDCPAPVAADVPWDTEHPGRCSECDPSFGCFNGSASCCKVPVDVDVCGKKCDRGSECLLLRGHDGGHDTQHGCTFYDPAPVAAPCAGCAAAKALLQSALVCSDVMLNAEWMDRYRLLLESGS